MNSKLAVQTATTWCVKINNVQVLTQLLIKMKKLQTIKC